MSSGNANHWADFLECVRNRQRPISDIEKVLPLDLQLPAGQRGSARRTAPGLGRARVDRGATRRAGLPHARLPTPVEARCMRIEERESGN